MTGNPGKLDAMLERLDRAQVAYSRGIVELPWASREQLLAELRHLDGAYSASAAFAAVGASRPVVFASAEDKRLVVAVIDVWMQNVGRDGLPTGIFDLRSALIDDLHDTAGGP